VKNLSLKDTNSGSQDKYKCGDNKCMPLSLQRSVFMSKTKYERENNPEEVIKIRSSLVLSIDYFLIVSKVCSAKLISVQ
jgi:hypothetical protein